MTTPTPPIFNELRRLAAISNSAAIPPTPTPQPDFYDAALASTSKDLRQQKIDAELAISSLRAQLSTTTNSTPNRTLLATIKANTRASTSTTDPLPPSPSPLNTLLATRLALRAYTNTLTALPTTRVALAETRAAAITARAQLGEELVLHAALQRRIDAGGTGAAAAGDDEARAEVKALAEKTRRVVRALNKFLKERLVGVLEIEELGGPVAGVACEEVDGGRVLARRRTGEEGQLTLEEAFRRERGGEGGGGGGLDEELKGLVERLMNKSLEAERYVELERESAVSRFLVRAKVAELHPRDARRIKLVDFSGSFED